MIPKKIYLNYVHEDDADKAWSEDPISCADCDIQNREYTDLSQVWHPAEEEPKFGKQLIGEETDSSFAIYKWVRQEDDWYILAKMFKLKRWAYIDDLLPKGDKI